MNDSPDNLSSRVRVAAACLLGVAALVACGGDSATSTQPVAAGAGAGAAATNAPTGAAGTSRAAGGSGASAAPPSGGASADAEAGAPAAASGAAGSTSGAGTGGATGAPAAGGGAAEPAQPAGPAAGAAAVRCKPREFGMGEARLHMHHIHFNTQDPDAQIEFVQKYFNAQPVDFCTDEASARTTRAAKTERAFFLYTKTDAPPSDMRKNRLAHVGYNTQDVQGELDRLNGLGAPLADCETAADGTPCNTFSVLWFYVETPETARFEIASGPGPSTSGFGHIHLIAPTYSFFQDVIGEAFQDPAGSPHVDGVNMVSGGRTGVVDETITYEDTRGAPVDHVGLSTTDLEGELARIEGTGVKIEEPISFKEEFGFRSFMVRSPEGVWLEIVEDAPFAP